MKGRERGKEGGREGGKGGKEGGGGKWRKKNTITPRGKKIDGVMGLIMLC